MIHREQYELLVNFNKSALKGLFSFPKFTAAAIYFCRVKHNSAFKAPAGRNEIIFNKVDRLDSNAAVLAFISFLELNFENYHTLELRSF